MCIHLSHSGKTHSLLACVIIAGNVIGCGSLNVVLDFSGPFFSKSWGKRLFWAFIYTIRDKFYHPLQDRDAFSKLVCFVKKSVRIFITSTYATLDSYPGTISKNVKVLFYHFVYGVSSVINDRYICSLVHRSYSRAGQKLGRRDYQYLAAILAKHFETVLRP